MESSSPEVVWNEVLDLHALILGWFDNRSLYHKIGYLVAIGQHLGDLVELAANRTKSSFEALLDARIRDELDLSPSDVAELSYDTDAHLGKCTRLLLLMNVETVRRMEYSTERYSFRSHRDETWSLEHIHAQNAESLTRADQWTEWLRLHAEALADLSGVDEPRRDALVDRMAVARDQVDRQTFQELAREVTALFTLLETSNSAGAHSVHSVSNLALLSCNDNSALGNAVFEVKRRRILELDRTGAYIPICTRQVFLKYYTDSHAQQLHFWSAQDRERYLEAMISPERGVVYPYLKPEIRGS
jgi:hypothetical protein